ncbi:MAG TPA: DUF3105 domain-containing protein [Solirubrobacterales bacterium]|nr:DUF3105 domain-containing protein [Solirubrobacterales bacterium]
MEAPSESGDPHINLDAGSTNGVPTDDRLGIEAPALPNMAPREAAGEAGCELRLRLPDEGHKHLPKDSPEPRYGTNPPTSGNHITDPYQQADGAYRETPSSSAVVHSLEHGRLAILYSPDLSEREQKELLGLYGTMYGGALLYPSEEVPYEVAAVTWTNLLGCADYRGVPTLGAIGAFGKATWGRFGGESVTGVNPAAPTPAQPSSS